MKLLSILQVIRHGLPPKESINLHYDSKHVIHGEQTFGAMQRLFSPPLSDCCFFKGKGGGETRLLFLFLPYSPFAAAARHSATCLFHREPL